MKQTMCSQTKFSRWKVKTSLPLIWILFWIHNSIAGFVDPDTPKEFHTMKAYTTGDNHEYELVSDPFESSTCQSFAITIATDNENQFQ
jgi:hypothetical protein